MWFENISFFVFLSNILFNSQLNKTVKMYRLKKTCILPKIIIICKKNNELYGTENN